MGSPVELGSRQLCSMLLPLGLAAATHTCPSSISHQTPTPASLANMRCCAASPSLTCAGGGNKRKGGRPGDMGHADEYGSGRFGGQLDREMQFFEKVKQRLRSKEQYQVRGVEGWL